jgi:hypothetical protein
LTCLGASGAGVPALVRNTGKVLRGKRVWRTAHGLPMRRDQGGNSPAGAARSVGVQVKSCPTARHRCQLPAGRLFCFGSSRSVVGEAVPGRTSPAVPPPSRRTVCPPGTESPRRRPDGSKS